MTKNSKTEFRSPTERSEIVNGMAELKNAMKLKNATIHELNFDGRLESLTSSSVSEFFHDQIKTEPKFEKRALSILGAISVSADIFQIINTSASDGKVENFDVKLKRIFQTTKCELDKTQFKRLKNSARSDVPNSEEIKAKIVDLRKKIEANDRLIEPRAPVGPMSARNKSYLRRLQEETILELARNNDQAGLWLIKGGLWSGNTSLLRAIENELAPNMDIHSMLVCLENGSHIDNLNDGNLEEKFLRSVGVVDDSIAEFGTTLDAFVTWILEKLKAKTSLVLLVDSIRTPARFEDSTDGAVAVLKLLSRAINHREIERLDPERTVRIFIATSGSAISLIEAHDIEKNAIPLPLPPLSPTEIDRLAAQLNIEPMNDEQKQNLYDLFHGQLHLTHRFLWEIRSGVNFNAELKNARSETSGYEGYWREVRKELGHMLALNGSGIHPAVAIDVLKSKINIQSSKYHHGSNFVDETWPKIAPTFAKLGIVSGSRDSPFVSEFIRSHLEREIKSTIPPSSANPLDSNFLERETQDGT